LRGNARPSTTLPEVTTTTPAVTTTTPAVTTTTPAVTTTTPAVTTTTPAVTTTTPATTTTTPAAVTTSSTPWGWIVAGIALLVALIFLVLLLRRRNQERALDAWRHETEGAVDAARVVQGLLPLSGQDISDSVHWQSTREQVEQAAALLDQSSTRAPTHEAASSARRTAGAMRELAFALESGRLLRESTSPPTAEQLVESDAATRARTANLEVALASLEVVVHPEQQKRATTTPPNP
jgi:hypothetical protein